jgi:hypothetical protein
VSLSAGLRKYFDVEDKLRRRKKLGYTVCPKFFDREAVKRSRSEAGR